MTPRTKAWVFAGLSGLAAMVALYCFLGVAQAVSLFEGERAVRNIKFWVPLTCIAVSFFAVFAIAAIYQACKLRR